MANPEHLAKLREGVEAWNEWRLSNQTIPDLKFADLIGADLSWANLSDAVLVRANLSRANLRGANLRDANLRDVELIDADLREAGLLMANLSDAILAGANLSGATFNWTDLSGADLSDANFAGAEFERTTFSGNDLRTTRGLENARHLGPSNIDIETIYMSEGKIPLSFLRGAGIPEVFIQYIPSLISPGAIQFYSCFISYSTKDQEFADRLYADLQNKGVRCWFAPHDVQGGKKLHEQIDEAIRVHERLLLILSPNSMSSKWVKTEIRNARKREVAEKKRVLFPVRLASYEALREWELFDSDEGEDLATEIREYYIPDFSEWKNHDLYVREFEKLLRDLRTGGAAAVEGIP